MQACASADVHNDLSSFPVAAVVHTDLSSFPGYLLLCRETVLLEIRRDAVIVPVPWQGQTIFLSVKKGCDAFNLSLKGKDAKRAISLSEAAAHLWEAAGKTWRQMAATKKEARRKERAGEKQLLSMRAERDSAWPISPPNLEGFVRLHAHTQAGDRWIKEPSS